MKSRRWPTSFPIGQTRAEPVSFCGPVPRCFPLWQWSANGPRADAMNQRPSAHSCKIADYHLVAQAHAGAHIVVTHEVPSASTRKIKIPDACIGLGVQCMTPYEMLRRACQIRSRSRRMTPGGELPLECLSKRSSRQMEWADHP